MTQPEPVISPRVWAHIRGLGWLCASLWLVRVTGEIAVMLATAWLLLSWVPTKPRRVARLVSLWYNGGERPGRPVAHKEA